MCVMKLHTILAVCLLGLCIFGCGEKLRPRGEVEDAGESLKTGPMGGREPMATRADGQPGLPGGVAPETLDPWE